MGQIYQHMHNESLRERVERKIGKRIFEKNIAKGFKRHKSIHPRN